MEPVVRHARRGEHVHRLSAGNQTYPSLIEYRFASTTGAVIANNLLDGSILARDGARATLTGNITAATAGMFVNPANGDLRLKATATAAIDRAAAVANCPIDWEGIARPQGTAADVGADEYGGSVPSAPRNLRLNGN